MSDLYDTERAWELCGAMLASPDVIPDVMREVEPADFGDGEVRRVYDAISRIMEQGGVPDPLLIRDELKAPDLVLRLMSAMRDSTVVPSNAALHARRLRALSMLRAVRDAGLELERVEPTDDPAEVIAAASEALRLAGQDVPSIDAGPAELMREAEAEEESVSRDEIIRTGLPSLDRMLGGGLYPSRLYVLGARTGIGKSALATNIVRLALDAGSRVLFVSLEMTGPEVLRRLVAEKYDLDHADLAHLIEAWNSDEVQAWPLHFMGLANVSTLAMAARRLRAQGLRLVVVDYVQLLPTTGKFERRDLEIGYITRTLKLLAVELGIPVLAISQVNRGADDDKPPRLANLRESGNLEQDCNVALLLHRQPDKPEKKSEAVLAVAKNRHGTLGPVHLRYLDIRCRFREAAYLGGVA